MITLGDCSDCTPCGGGGGHCDLFAFVLAGTRDAIDGESLFTANEGYDITLTVARLPDCFRYHGAPADYEAEFGYPPPVADGDYHYDTTTTGDFWLNTGGVFTLEPAPAWYGVGEIDIDYALTFTECGCPHMLTAASGTLTFPSGDTADQYIVAPVTCPGPPTYWACSGDLAGGESGTVTLTVASESGGCASVGYAANIVGLCTHAPPFPPWGNVPYYARFWAGHDIPSTGWKGMNGTGRFLGLDYSFSVPAEGYEEHIVSRLFPSGNRYATYSGPSGEPGTGGGEDFFIIAQAHPDGIISDSRFYKDLGAFGIYDITLSEAHGNYGDAGDPDANLAAARIAYPDGINGSYGWNGEGTLYVYTIKGSAAWWSPDFDPDTYYTATGSVAASIPFADWTVTADPGSVWVQAAVTDPQAFGVTNFNPNGLAGRNSVGNVWETDMDATNSKLGNPIPQTVEIRLLYYEDFVLLTTGPWIEITDTIYPIPAPSGLGGASLIAYYVAEIRTAYVNALCVPSVSPVFVCHPGIVSCP